MNNIIKELDNKSTVLSNFNNNNFLAIIQLIG